MASMQGKRDVTMCLWIACISVVYFIIIMAKSGT